MAKDTLPLEDEAEVVDVDSSTEPGGVTNPVPPPDPGGVKPGQPAESAMVPVQTAETTLMRELWVVAERVASTEFVPKGLRGKPDKVFAAVLAGREIGLAPMASLKHVSIIEGSPNLSAEATLALIRKAGHKVDGGATDQHAEITGTRIDTGESMTVTVTLDDALAAGWIDRIEEVDGTRKAIARSKEKGLPKAWEHHTAAMLWARAVTKLKTRLFSDVVIGWFGKLADDDTADV